MFKQWIDRKRWSGVQLTAGLCIAVSIALIGAALLQKGSDDQPQWTAMNAQVDRALDLIEQGKADGQEQAGGKETGAPAAAAVRSEGAEQKPPAGTKDAPAAGTKDMPAAGAASNGGAEGAPASAGASEAATPPAKGGGAGMAADPDAASQSSQDGKIDVNHASSAELDALPGIGASKAEAIVADRERNGPFRSADDLLRVKGIGPKLLDTMKSLIVLGP